MDQLNPHHRSGCPAARDQRLGARPARRGHDACAVITAAAAGDERAWQLLVGRYGATIAAVTRRHRLGAADRDEVAQRTWLRLVEHIWTIREPAALGGWLQTTARNECLRVLASSRRETPVDDEFLAEQPDDANLEDGLAERERKAALRGALERLTPRQQRIVRLLLMEPALSYAELSERLGVPQGSLGPTRQRCLARLRRDPHLAAVVRAAARPRAIGHDLGLA
jgi:RNA polymerase sigma factor (sigma-70 family)